MPYFVYRITEPKKLEKLDQFDNYKQAREAARSMRAESMDSPGSLIRMIFAKNEVEAEKLLLAPREQRFIDEG
ncbi:MAG: hypothetical protein HQL47_03900 [Gammaproteobacteria bacterium]|nr:hypothetical protein [Gammaproteobacteria bacterium]